MHHHGLRFASVGRDMVVLPKKLDFGPSNCRRLAAFGLAVGLFCLLPMSIQAAPPNPPTLTLRQSRLGMSLAASNCTDTNIQYVTQTSTDLNNWSPLATNQGRPGNFTNFFGPPTNSAGFFRLMANPGPGPIYQFAIACGSNIALRGNGNIIDSFDSSDTNYSTAGRWDATKRKANANVATSSSGLPAMDLGNSIIYGSIFTVPGTTMLRNVEIGPNCSVGDLGWVNTSFGIQSNHWAGNFNARFPDLPAPTFVGLPFPAPDGFGNINLTASNGTYVATSWTNLLIVKAPSTIWVQGSLNLLTKSVVFTNHGSLVLYVGRTNATGDALSISGTGSVNSPGYAINFQIFGLPSLNTISFATSGIVGCIYAPDANLTCGGGGNNVADSSGAIIAKSVIANGHWNFHFDENLLVNGPSR